MAVDTPVLYFFLKKKKKLHITTCSFLEHLSRIFNLLTTSYPAFPECEAILIDLHIIIKHIWASQVALVVKNPPTSAGDMRDVGLIPGLGRSSGGGHGNHSSIVA